MAYILLNQYFIKGAIDSGLNKNDCAIDKIMKGNTVISSMMSSAFSLALGNIVVHPFPEKFEGGDTMQVEEITVMCGGDAFNQATVLSALGHKTALISKVADDVTGNMVLDQMKARGVDILWFIWIKRMGQAP